MTPCCTAFLPWLVRPDSARHRRRSTPLFDLRCRPPPRSAHHSLLTILPHGHQPRRVHLFSLQRFVQWIAPFPVSQPGSCSNIPLRQQPKPSSLSRFPVSSFL